jgi:hypothetical protein
MIPAGMSDFMQVVFLNESYDIERDRDERKRYSEREREERRER